jgi:pimeloyl-ACP methyl ester carboxylesterase
MSKEPLVFLPGTLCTDATFAAQHRHLADVADCLTLPLSTGSTMPEMAAWVLEQTPAQFALGGFSQGALVALEIMRQAPERISRLCLMACNPRGSTQGQLDTWRSWQAQARDEGLANLAALFAANVHPNHRVDSQIVQRIHDMAIQTGVDTFVTQLDALASRIDSRPYLNVIHCPTLLLVGEADKLTPLFFHEEVQQLIPHARLIVMPECGHYLPLEQPVAVSAVLRYWLQE